MKNEFDIQSRISELCSDIERWYGVRHMHAQEREKEMAAFDKLLAGAQSLGSLISFGLDEGITSRERILAIMILGKLGDRSACDALIILLQHQDNSISFHASEGLRKLASKTELVQVLRVLKNSSYAHSRAGAAWILHDQFFPEAAWRLRYIAVHDPEPLVRVAAVTAIIRYPCLQT
jgi:HEAT repeat protein